MTDKMMINWDLLITSTMLWLVTKLSSLAKHLKVDMENLSHLERKPQSWSTLLESHISRLRSLAAVHFPEWLNIWLGLTDTSISLLNVTKEEFDFVAFFVLPISARRTCPFLASLTLCCLALDHQSCAFRGYPGSCFKTFMWYLSPPDLCLY